MTKKNRQYTIEEKEMLINRILPPENCSARALANENGARLIPACETVGISKRTYERWYRDGKILEDRRKDAIRPEPSNKL